MPATTVKILLHQIEFGVVELVYCLEMGFNFAHYSTTFLSMFSKHLLCWSIFIAYELTYIHLMTGRLPDAYAIILNYVLNMSLFYFNAHVLLHYFNEKIGASWFVIIAVIAIEIMTFIVIKYAVNLFVVGERIRLTTSEEMRVYAVSNTLRTFYYISFSTAYWFSIITIQRNKKISELETQRLNQRNETILMQKDLMVARNAYLQSQVNPHFLFNTLNFMYNASTKVSGELSNAILTLSDIMRYALTNIEEDEKVLLQKEIDHIKNFIHLNQIRFDQHLSIVFAVNGNIEHIRIIPLSLITLVENVFKYGDLLDSDDPASILLSVDSNELDFRISNKKRTGSVITGHGTGLKNLKERLDIHYPNAYTMEINDIESTYSIKLTLSHRII